jgi:hypothetical protein
MIMWDPRPLVGALLVVATGCAPTLVSGTMTNPARSNDKIQSSQEYDLGPYKENHRYQITLKDWTPATLGVQIKLVDTDDCARPQSYSFTLVDDHGERYPLRTTSAATETTEPGRGNTTLKASTIPGRFDVAVGPKTRGITIEERPQPNISCPALDFRWTFDNTAASQAGN